jgi:hypothetical protein
VGYEIFFLRSSRDSPQSTNRLQDDCALSGEITRTAGEKNIMIEMSEMWAIFGPVGIDKF